MSRKCRRVPAGWVHPFDFARKQHVPLHNGFDAAKREYDEISAKWEDGLVEDYLDGGWKPREPGYSTTLEEWHGERPDPANYCPDWPEAERTHYQMYEETSEGTPISPVFATPEDLARWLADNGASAFAGMTLSYERWLEIAKGKPTIGFVAIRRADGTITDEEPR